jgi:hypothetical protein
MGLAEGRVDDLRLADRDNFRVADFNQVIKAPDDGLGEAGNGERDDCSGGSKIPFG